MEKPWKVILAFIGVFAAGAIFGGVFTIGVDKKFHADVMKAMQQQGAKIQARAQALPKTGAPTANATTPAPTGRGMTPMVMRQLTQRLSPTPDQQKAIRTIVLRANDDWQRLGRDHIAEVERVTVRMYEDISALLSPEQRTQLEKMRQDTLEKARLERLKRMAPAEPPKEGANLPGALPRPANTPAPTK